MQSLNNNINVMSCMCDSKVLRYDLGDELEQPMRNVLKQLGLKVKEHFVFQNGPDGQVEHYLVVECLNFGSRSYINDVRFERLVKNLKGYHIKVVVCSRLTIFTRFQLHILRKMGVKFVVIGRQIHNMSKRALKTVKTFILSRFMSILHLSPYYYNRNRPNDRNRPNKSSNSYNTRQTRLKSSSDIDNTRKTPSYRKSNTVPFVVAESVSVPFDDEPSGLDTFELNDFYIELCYLRYYGTEMLND